MNEDKILQNFADLIPGKKAPVNRPVLTSTPEVQWDLKPLVYMHNGKEREYFSISHLAAALDKAPVTIRSWENRGLLPPSPYRSPRPRRETIPGRDPKGKRLWTRDQINGIIEIAREEDVIFNGTPPNQRFAERVRILFKTLLDKDTPTP